MVCCSHIDVVFCLRCIRQTQITHINKEKHEGLSLRKHVFFTRFAHITCHLVLKEQTSLPWQPQHHHPHNNHIDSIVLEQICVTTCLANSKHTNLTSQLVLRQEDAGTRTQTHTHTQLHVLLQGYTHRRRRPSTYN